MANSPNREATPTNKRQRVPPKASSKTDKKKRLTTSSIASITPVNLDTSESEEEENMATKDQTGGEACPEGAEFAVKKPATTPVIQVSDLERILDKRFSVLATAAQINRMGERIERNENEISAIKGELRQINKKITDQAEKVTPDLRMDAENEGAWTTNISGKETSYLRSRKSLRIWPIEGGSRQQMTDELQKFMRDALRISPEDVRGIQIEDIRRTRPSPNSQNYMEICAIFRDTDDRDFVASRAVNLGSLIQLSLIHI